jgi:DNA-directed RNA polymerase specialized sigma24 family protein
VPVAKRGHDARWVWLKFYDDHQPLAGADITLEEPLDTGRLVEARVDLRRLVTLARCLTPDQRLLLFARVALDMSATEFCERHAWSLEKYRKIDQRGRAKLRLATESPSSCEGLASPERTDRLEEQCRWSMAGGSPA